MTKGRTVPEIQSKLAVKTAMTGQKCTVCGNTKASDPSVSFHRVPKDPIKLAEWLDLLQLQEDSIKPSTRVCSRHFPGGDPSKSPSLTLGKRFASPLKQGSRAKRAKTREEQRYLHSHSLTPVHSTPSRSVTPSVTSSGTGPVTPPPQCKIAQAGEQLETNYLVHELPGSSGMEPEECRVINQALLTRLELLESEKKKTVSKKDKQYFRIEDIQHDDKLVQFYTGFTSFALFLAFFELLGPAVNHLNYWGSKVGVRKRLRLRKIDPKNQLFLVLVKLRLNLRHRDLAFRFGLSVSLVSRYITTWICFLYRELQDIDWIPSIAQVFGSQPSDFREKFPTTYAIIDGSEVFIETPSDLHLQSSTGSQYKHHNTVKFLVACTPNGAIFFISPVYVGAISDVELTRLSGFLDVLQGKSGISVMADRGFNIKDLLKDIGVELNIPPFMEGRQQLPPQEIETGRRIASLRIHVERAIGRMKHYSILKSTVPISLTRLTNQIIFVCAFLTNFQPVLIPLPAEGTGDGDVESYFEQLSDSEHDTDCSDSESEF